MVGWLGGLMLVAWLFPMLIDVVIPYLLTGSC